MRDGTRAAMLVFGRMLAEDAEPAISAAEAGRAGPEAMGFAGVAGVVLDLLDTLDVGPDEERDRQVAELSLAPGEVWLRLAEEGRLPARWIHLVIEYYSGRGVLAYRSPYESALFAAIAVASDEELDTLALAYPEYVGLTKAIRHDREAAMQRLRATR